MITPFQLFTIDMKEENKATFAHLSFLEVARKIAFLWTQMSQSERRVYYERAGKHVDKSLSAKLRSLTTEDSEPKSGDELPSPKRKSVGSPEPGESPKRVNSDSHDSDEGDYIGFRRNARRGKPGKPERQTYEDMGEETAPRRRGARRRKIFGAP